MENRTIKNIVVGSVLAVALFGAGVGLSTTNKAVNGSSIMGTTTTQSVQSTTKIGETTGPLTVAGFSNLESFDNDGFNKSVKDAAIAYAGEGVNLETSSGYSDSGQEYVEQLKAMYDENDMIISAGFQVANAFTGIAPTIGDDGTATDPGFAGVFTDPTKETPEDTELANDTTKSVVLLDDTSLASNYTNAASVSYAAEGAGFITGIGSAIYTEYDVAHNDKNNGNIVMWGGMNFPTVYDYMSGFAQAINLANETYQGKKITIDGEETEYKYISLWNGGQKSGDLLSKDNSYYGTTSEDASDWFTWGFDAAVGTDSGDLAKIKTTNAINSGASLVFPIAGGNTTVAEQTLVNAPKSSTTKLLGVDVDSQSYSSEPDLYVGSATKNLVDGGYNALWGMDYAEGAEFRNYSNTEAKGKPEDFDSWKVDEGEGLQLKGTIENGGVGFTLNENMITALTAVGMTEEQFETYWTTASETAGTLISDDAMFAGEAGTVVKDVTAPADEIIANEAPTSSLDWLWITLGVVLGLVVVGIVIWILLKFVFNKDKKTKEEF